MPAANLLARMLAPTGTGEAFSDRALIAAMLQVESALARCQARLGLIPAEAAVIIGEQARTLPIDPEALLQQARASGSLAVPLVAALSESVHARDPSASHHVHYGATTQDVIDSAMALCTRAALDGIDRSLATTVHAASALARQHATAPTLARTLLQAAGITTIGWKFAHDALGLHRCRRRLRDTASDALAVSLAGPIGNLASFGALGPLLRAALATELGLADPGASWHSHRDRWIALATDTALLTGSVAKIAGDIALLAQTEVGEIRLSSPGQGGSSAMPHKRNPVLAMRALAAAQPVPGIVAGLLAGMRQAHERALGEWQAELAQWPVLYGHAADAVSALADLFEQIEADPLRARDNIDRQHGVLFSAALADLVATVLGRNDAHALVAGWCASALSGRQPLLDIALAARQGDPRLQAVTPDALAAVFDVDAAAVASAREVDDLLVLVDTA